MSELSSTQARSGRRRWITAVLGLVAVVLLAWYGLAAQAPLVGKPAPDWSLTTLDGQTLNLAHLRGKVVVLNFWASWCAPCRAEADALENVWREYQARGVAFIGVSFKNVDSAARRFVHDLDITYPTGKDPYGRTARAYGVYAVPETFFISKAGLLSSRHVGEITEAKLRSVLEELLGQ